MRGTDQWRPGVWCGSAIKLCDQHVVEFSAEQDIRYPEQWMYVLWQPAYRAVPFLRPDGWGVTLGHPRETMAQCLPVEAEIYILADAECAWSSWLQIPLVCERYEPWLVAQIEARRQEQRQLESSRYAQWYGSTQVDFERFLAKLSAK